MAWKASNKSAMNQSRFNHSPKICLDINGTVIEDGQKYLPLEMDVCTEVIFYQSILFNDSKDLTDQSNSPILVHLYGW